MDTNRTNLGSNQQFSAEAAGNTANSQQYLQNDQSTPDPQTFAQAGSAPLQSSAPLRKSNNPFEEFLPNSAHAEASTSSVPQHSTSASAQYNQQTSRYNQQQNLANMSGIQSPNQAYESANQPPTQNASNSDKYSPENQQYTVNTMYSQSLNAAQSSNNYAAFGSQPAQSPIQDHTQLQGNPHGQDQAQLQSQAQIQAQNQNQNQSQFQAQPQVQGQAQVSGVSPNQIQTQMVNTAPTKFNSAQLADQTSISSPNPTMYQQVYGSTSDSNSTLCQQNVATSQPNNQAYQQTTQASFDTPVAQQGTGTTAVGYGYGYGGNTVKGNANTSSPAIAIAPTTYAPAAAAAVTSLSTSTSGPQPNTSYSPAQSINSNALSFTGSAPAPATTSTYGFGYGGNNTASAMTQSSSDMTQPNALNNTSNIQPIVAGVAAMSVASSVVGSSYSPQPSQASTFAQGASAASATGYGQADGKQPTTNIAPVVKKAIYGPVVQFLTTDLIKAEWVGTMLVLTDSSFYTSKVGPCIHIWEDERNTSRVSTAEKYTARPLFDDTTNKFKFWIVNLRLPIPTTEEKFIYYQAISAEGTETHKSDLSKFMIPSQKTPWRWSCFSNDDVSYTSDAIIKNTRICESLWPDLIEKHNILPFHAMLGMGGQINGDGLWYDLGVGNTNPEYQMAESYYANSSFKPQAGVPNFTGPLGPFVGMYSSSGGIKYTSNESRKSVAWNTATEEAVSKWYFARYMQRWFNSERHGSTRKNYEPSMASALHTIPYMFCLDENDIFPGYGSYPSELMDTPVFRGIYSVALKYWSLFQAHTTWTAIQTNRVQDNPFVSALGLHWVRNLGPYVSILGLDVTSEKNKRQVISHYAYEDIFRAIESRVSTQVQHLLIASPVPVVYPHTMYLDNILSGAKNMGMMGFINYAQRKFSAPSYNPIMPEPNKQNDNFSTEFNAATSNTAVDNLGENKSLLGLNTLWTSGNHLQEREMFVIKLQLLAQTRMTMRLSFISGHVNNCSAGRFVSVENSYPGDDTDHHETVDNKLMIQLVSASMSDIPIDSTTLKGLYISGKTKSLDGYTVEKLYKTFKLDVNKRPPTNGNRKLLARRSYITMEQFIVFDSPSFATPGATYPPTTSLRANFYVENAGESTNLVTAQSMTTSPPAQNYNPSSGSNSYNAYQQYATPAVSSSPASLQTSLSTVNYPVDIPNLNLYNKSYNTTQYGSSYSFPQASFAGGFPPQPIAPVSPPPSTMYYPQSSPLTQPIVPAAATTSYSQPAYSSQAPAPQASGAALSAPATNNQVPTEPPPPYSMVAQNNPPATR